MDPKDRKFQCPGICNKLYHFVTKTIARHALKTVALGRPLPHGSAQKPVSHNGSSKGSQAVHAVAQSEPRSNDAGSYELEGQPVQDSVSGTTCKVEDDKRKSGMPGILETKAPKKSVSINDEVEEIRISKKRIICKEPSERLRSFEPDIESPKPLRSILKLGSNLTEDS